MSKVLVALDPFTRADSKAKRAMRTLRSFSDQLNAKLQTVAVVSPDQLKLPVDFEKNLADELLSSAKKNINKKQAAMSVTFDDEPEVAVQPYRSTKSSIQAITKTADDVEADFIAVLTHVKKRTSNRALFGFVESLISVSNKPVIAINGQGSEIKKIRTIAFASDFSSQCKTAFIQTLELARSLDARVVVIHKSVKFEDYAALASGVASPIIQAYEPILLAEEEQVARATAEWTNLAELQNVPIEFIVTRRSGRVGEIVTKVAASKKADLIVVVSQSGKYESLIIGSVTRAVLQTAKVPVLVIREHSLAKRKSNRKIQGEKFDNIQTLRNSRISATNN